MRAFFDSSGLAKRYIKEQGSDKIEALLAEASEAAVSLICPPEITAALSRLRRQNSISATQYETAKKALFEDIEDMSVCAITIPVVHGAIGLIERFPLRTMDALHVACAIEWRADLFVSSDRRQLAAAAKSGLRVIQV
jgi:predicted nucleic acid-binding protein